MENSRSPFFTLAVKLYKDNNLISQYLIYLKLILDYFIDVKIGAEFIINSQFISIV